MVVFASVTFACRFSMISFRAAQDHQAAIEKERAEVAKDITAQVLLTD